MDVTTQKDALVLAGHLENLDGFASPANGSANWKNADCKDCAAPPNGWDSSK